MGGSTLQKICTILGYSPEQSQEIQKLFVETVLFSHSTEMVNMLSEDKKKELVEKMQSKDADPQHIVDWLKGTISLTDEQKFKFKENMNQTSREFFIKLLEGISDDKKSQIQALLQN